MSDTYILKNQIPVPVEDIVLWGQFLQTNEKIVQQTVINDEVHVSTVFLGVDHRWDRNGPPILFETMIFGGPQNEYQERYCTWEQAERGHAEAVELAKSQYYSWIKRLLKKFFK